MCNNENGFGHAEPEGKLIRMSKVKQIFWQQLEAHISNAHHLPRDTHCATLVNFTEGRRKKDGS